MWVYSQSTGELSGIGQGVITYGYSGAGEGRNNPEMQAVKNVGPIPRGRWTITSVFDSQLHGPFCLRLAPAAGTDTLGRDGFLIHGDSAAHPGEASQGCIILPRRMREYIWQSGSRIVEVLL